MKYCRINNYLCHSSALYEIKMMNYLPVHRYLQPKVYSYDHSCDISSKLIHFPPILHTIYCSRHNTKNFYQGFLTAHRIGVQADHILSASILFVWKLRLFFWFLFLNLIIVLSLFCFLWQTSRFSASQRQSFLNILFKFKVVYWMRNRTYLQHFTYNILMIDRNVYF